MKKHWSTLLSVLTVLCLLAVFGISAIAEDAVEAPEAPAIEAILAEDEAPSEEIAAEPVEEAVEEVEFDLSELATEEELPEEPVLTEELRNELLANVSVDAKLDAAETCTHPSRYVDIDWDWDWSGKFTYESIDDAYHTETGMIIWTTYCYKCDTVLSQSEPVEFTRRFRHEYYALHDDDDDYDDDEESGDYEPPTTICEYCNHECQHTNTGEYDYADGGKFKAVDAYYHTVSGTYYTITYCADCAVEISEVAHKGTAKDTHYWDDETGKCIECGYKCKHPDLINYQYYYVTYEEDGELEVSHDYEPDPKASTFKSIDNRYHSVTTKIVYEPFCPTCYVYLDVTKPKTMTVQDEHRYEDGVCVYCGHVNTCKHENLTHVEELYEDYGSYYEPVDSKTHYAEGFGPVYDLCEDCGETFNRTTKYFGKNLPHELNRGGVCVFCGISANPDLNIEEYTLGVGQTFALKSEVAGLKFKSSSTKVATVSAKGVITAKGAGTAIITATAPYGLSTDCTITVLKAPSKVTMAKTATLGVGETEADTETLALVATLSPAGCLEGVTFKSSNANIASVDPETGLVTPIKAGKVTITATTWNKKTAKCTVTVKATPTAIALSKDDPIVLNVKGTVTLKATLTPSNAKAENTFTSSDPAVATVTAAGKVTAKSAGSALITVSTYNGLTAARQVVVYNAPSKVTLNTKSVTVTSGQEVRLQAFINGLETTPADVNPTVTWSTTNKAIATVEDGLVKTTGKKAGTVTITVKTSNGKKATCKVIVKAAPKTVKATAAKTVLGVGETTQAKATLTKNSYSDIAWTVTGAAATVDEKGVVTAVKAGTATVTATAVNGVSGSVEITVLPTPNTLTVNDLTLKKSKSATLKVELPEGTAAGLTFTSSDPTIATVSDAGKVTAKKKAGTVTITVTTHDGKASATSTVTVK